jgi:predicted MFS family arabinose efflux permease
VGKNNEGQKQPAVEDILLCSRLASFDHLGAAQGAQFGWITLSSWPFLAGGLGLLALYVIWASRHAHPAVDLKLLRHPQPALAVGLSTLVAIVLFVMVFLIPVFLETVRGFSPLVAGLTLLPQGLVTGVGTVLGNRLTARRGTRVSAILGMAILTGSTVALFAVQIATPAWVTALILSGRGLALGLTLQPLLNTLMGSLPPEQIPDGNTLFNVAQRLGGSIGSDDAQRERLLGCGEDAHHHLQQAAIFQAGLQQLSRGKLRQFVRAQSEQRVPM